jgi:lipopolysaccharide/colanic/teichoic acid biosynthesis glycosyltransferase
LVTTRSCISHFTDETKERILQLKRKDGVDGILLANPDATKEEITGIKTFADVNQLTFFYSADLFPASSLRPLVHTLAGRPLIEVPTTPLDGWGAIYKRAFDVLGSLILIILTLPIQILVALALFIEQPGDVFFRKLPDGKRAVRVGQGGRVFHYFKFRSMVKDAHKYRFDPKFIEQHGNMREGTPLFKLENDPRVTPVGRFIRKYSLDEIPEFYLVLLGRMSLVGPRPHLPEEVAMYKPEHKKVLTIKPGITGLAQISGRANLDFDDEVRLDMYYIENWNPWRDLLILLKTPLAVIFRRGAY